MESKKNLILVCAGADSAAAASHGLPVLYLCMGVGAGGRIQRLRLPAQAAGNYLGVSDFGVDGPVPRFCAEALVYEVKKRGMRGLFADFERDLPGIHGLLRDLDTLLQAEGLTLFVPFCQAAQVSNAVLVTETALSGGSLEGFMGGLLQQYPGRIAATLRPVSADYRLPAETSEGTNLPAQDRQALQQRHGAQAFFSHELCAKYFTYMDEKGDGHFVLFDDLSTLEAKYARLSALAVSPVFALYPDVRALL